MSLFWSVSILAVLHLTSRGNNPTTINSSSRNETSSAGEAQWILVYSALGTVAFVFTVISLSVLSMRKGHPKRRTQMENQGISMENQHIGVKLLTRQTASDSPTMKETPPSPLPRDGSYICSQPSKGKEDNPNKRMEEEESGIVYAALNHQLPPGGAARPWRPKEERSEYAAILV
uniref:uncharacterized protein LOC131104577 isoform X3 n=1 Tax=Doryrhamphus excisus TaxID=161450 RepID=UPI0025ADB8D0|nr:uncharacterized protein LOC131104577 isoform X3 [Doryrhamphus excisus]